MMVMFGGIHEKVLYEGHYNFIALIKQHTRDNSIGNTIIDLRILLYLVFKGDDKVHSNKCKIINTVTSDPLL